MLTENPAPQRIARPTRSYVQMPRFQRVKVSVLGRYMLADRREFPCQILEMSPGDAVVIAPVAGIVHKLPCKSIISVRPSGDSAAAIDVPSRIVRLTC